MNISLEKNISRNYFPKIPIRIHQWFPRSGVYRASWLEKVARGSCKKVARNEGRRVHFSELPPLWLSSTTSDQVSLRLAESTDVLSVPGRTAWYERCTVFLFPVTLLAMVVSVRFIALLCFSNCWYSTPLFMTYIYGDEKIRNLHKNIQKWIIAIDLLINEQFALNFLRAYIKLN